jgi:hypothetical protein
VTGNALPRQVDDHLARELDPDELLDPAVVPTEGALGGVRAPSRR